MKELEEGRMSSYDWDQEGSLSKMQYPEGFKNSSHFTS